MDLTSRRCPFVVLHHTGHGEPHYDLMIDIDGESPLLTWRTPAWPIEDASRCQPLAPHRRVYLNYEGPVSGGRGAVHRVLHGTLVIEHPIGTLITVHVDEPRMTFSLKVKT